MTSEESDILCPCKSGKLYSTCCKPYHLGILPENAKDLMRSRYSAYVLNLSDYIIKTTHPKNPSYKLPLEQFKKDIEQFCNITTFEDLKVLDFSEKGDEAFVTFTAILSQGEKNVSFTEKSRFLKENGKWLYLDGKFLPLAT